MIIKNPIYLARVGDERRAAAKSEAERAALELLARDAAIIHDAAAALPEPPDSVRDALGSDPVVEGAALATLAKLPEWRVEELYEAARRTLDGALAHFDKLLSEAGAPRKRRPS